MSGKKVQHGQAARMGEFLTATRAEILRRLYEGGSQALGTIHRGWPMTKYHARLVVGALAEEGLVEVTDVDGNVWSRRVELTSAGRAGVTNPAEEDPRSQSAREKGMDKRPAGSRAAAEGLLQQSPPQSTAA